MRTEVSPLVSIHPNAQIGVDVTIDPFTTIHNDVIIGNNTWIGSNVTIMPGARIGDNCRIFPGAVISAIPQDLKFSGEESTVIIGNNTTIRECVTINRGTVDKMTTKIGDNCLLMAYVHIAHDCELGNNCIIANAVNMAGHVQVGDYAVIGGMSALHQFVKIGEHAMISGGSLIRKDVPPYVKAGREPLSYVGINSTGLKRRGFTNEEITDIQSIYRHIFVLNTNVAKGVNEVKDNFKNSRFKSSILDFIENSNRGLLKGYTKDKSSKQ